MEKASAGWEERVRTRFFARWIGQLGVIAGEIRQAGICDMVEEKEIPAELLEGTESQQTRRALSKEQWLQRCHEKKSLEWDLREARKAQAKEDSQIRKGQWKPPTGSRKRHQNEGRNDSFLPSSDEDSEGHADGVYEWDDEPVVQ